MQSDIILITYIYCIGWLTIMFVSFYVNTQAEGSEVSAELEFLNQQNLILSMENKALKQRLESLAQEQLIKYRKFLQYELSIYIFK